MSNTVFTTIPYPLGRLLGDIDLGVIGLPDIQRPFVWSNAKVRDLLDSMYRGYPVGYLLFWKNGLKDDRAIGSDDKRETPEKVIVDGQQRLTSLYAVMKGRPIVDKEWKNRRIQVAFSPMKERFEVANAAIRRDKSFIADISIMWSTDVFDVRDECIRMLPSGSAPETITRVQSAIQRLYALKDFPFIALELSASVTAEDVSKVFVRVNSKGVSLKQADFILTLMSVFWDEGRKELESFCRAAKKPAKDAARSPFNCFIEPEPAQMLRVNVGVGFRRAQFRHVYSILRGKDVDTGEFSDELRKKQFAILKAAQDLTLNRSYWHDFMSCVRLAGFRSGKMISSQTNLLFSYILYLIGRKEYEVDIVLLRRAIAQWFFMSATTGRFSGSSETDMERDLSRLRNVTDAIEFVRTLTDVCKTVLTGDFWKTTFPQDLATAAPRSPSFFAYNAALILLDAPILYSNNKMSDLLDPGVSSGREVEKHHLFPRRYLERIGHGDAKSMNQVANLAYVDRLDNAQIVDKAPAEYVPTLEERFDMANLDAMYRMHALPKGWELMEYPVFLRHRRDLMAGITRDGYNRLAEGEDVREVDDDGVDLDVLIGHGESEVLEFKSTLRINLHTNEKDGKIEMGVLKTIAGFLNKNGGTLIIGVNNDGMPVGIDADRFDDEDKMSLHLVNIVSEKLGSAAMSRVRIRFCLVQGKRLLVVVCAKSRKPVYVRDGRAERFFVRTGPATHELTSKATVEYVDDWFG